MERSYRGVKAAMHGLDVQKKHFIFHCKMGLLNVMNLKGFR